jgi:hypothetical protein
VKYAGVISIALAALAALLGAATISCATDVRRASESGDGTIESATSQAAESQGIPKSPQTFIDTTQRSVSAHKLAASSAQEFQSALDRAAPGDIIELPARQTISGNFVLPNKTAPNQASQWIVIRSSSESSLPAGTRVSPATSAAMPKLVSPNADPVLRAASGAHHFRLIGLELAASPGAHVTNLIRLGEGDETDASALPRDIIIDRCYIHGNPTASVRRGVALNSASTAIIDSWISDCHEVGADSQAICGWNGPGPFKIVNNYLEGAGENVMFGGADPKITGLVPSDIEFRRNHCAKPLAWKSGHPSFAGTKWSVKNLLELKNAQRVLIEDNLFENCWVDAQTGCAVLFKSVNQDGSAAWCATQDVQFKNNIVRHAGGGLNIQGRAQDQLGGQTRRINIENNLFEDIGGAMWGGDGAFLKITESDGVTLDHNTVIQSGNIITAYGPPSNGFRFTNNLVRHNEFGVKGDSAAPGNDTLNRYFPGAVFKRNILVGGERSRYPDGNSLVASLDQVGFAVRHEGDYRLSDKSSFKNAGSDGHDIGCDIERLRPAINSSQPSAKADESSR